ncbi:ABC transporter ATP-binding protein [Pseudovibrio flavus]|uniref:ABC transporter ATP-binding protein n=1 Tax=Pseudovibrio flavus TaxID=2529854 RepID=UPI0012BC5869|nr:ABC transporter ATP-binding protein [Pseudovibrio flavus]
MSDGHVRAVDRVSFTVPPNKCVALVGESGSGKTVISQAIMGLLPPKAQIASGSILLHDRQNPGQMTDLAGLSPSGRSMRRIRGNRVAIIFQEPMTSLSPLHTIGDQISEAAILHRNVGRREAKEFTLQMLKMVHFPDPARGFNAYPFELSGGLRQRAMIAMALICRPSILIADEPTTALDVTIQAQILKLIKEMQQEFKMSLLMITHDFGVVANMADEVVVVYHGRVMEKGSARQLFNDPQHPYLQALLKAVPTFGMEKTQRLETLRPIKPHGEGLSQLYTRNADQLDGPILKLEGVSKSFISRKQGLFGSGYEPVKALDDVSLEVRQGECLGIVGESGSGKTTVAKAILRAFQPDSGTVSFNSGIGLRDIASYDSKDMLAYRSSVQMIFQDPFSSLNPRMTVSDILQEPLVIHGIGSKWERSRFASDLMELVGLDPRYLRRYPHSFSGGQRQRIGIARALALNPELILCDEPTSALDVSVQAQILNLLQDLKRDLGLTYVFISHNLAVVDYIADRIAVMCKGRLVELGPTEQVIEHPIHPYTKALLRAVPEPNLDHPLDFSSPDMKGTSNPFLWPEPYRIPEGSAPKLVQIAPDHFVCAPGLVP